MVSSYMSSNRNVYGKHRLLGHAEICALARRVQDGIEAESGLIRGAAGSPESTEQHRLEERVTIGIEAKQRIVEHNLRLVAHWALRYAVDGMEQDDHLQNGYFGLVRAVEKFDPDEGTQFSTYASWWIRQSIHRGISNQARLIRLPVYLLDSVAKLNRARDRLLIETGSTSREQLASMTGFSLEKVGQLQQITPGVSSLDAVVGDGLTTIGDLIPADDGGDLDAEAISAVRDALAILTDRERDIFRRRYGSLDADGETLEQVGNHFGLTRERVRQIEKRAIEKIIPIVREALCLTQDLTQPAIGSQESQWEWNLEKVTNFKQLAPFRLSRAIDALADEGGKLCIAAFLKAVGKSNGGYLTRITTLAAAIESMPTPIIVIDEHIQLNEVFCSLW